jgi:hypothetical protein
MGSSLGSPELLAESADPFERSHPEFRVAPKSWKALIAFAGSPMRAEPRADDSALLCPLDYREELGMPGRFGLSDDSPLSTMISRSSAPTTSAMARIFSALGKSGGERVSGFLLTGVVVLPRWR